MSVDPVTGDVNISFYDTRNDTTGSRYMTDVYFGGVFPCAGINYGNQYGDYEGLVSYGGASYPIWTDSRRQLDPISGCSRGLAMEEVFTAKVK